MGHESLDRSLFALHEVPSSIANCLVCCLGILKAFDTLGRLSTVPVVDLISLLCSQHSKHNRAPLLHCCTINADSDKQVSVKQSRSVYGCCMVWPICNCLERVAAGLLEDCWRAESIAPIVVL